MPSALPVGDPVPADGRLPRSVAGAVRGRDLGIYLHVPFCRVRCGYCDFNTYTATELGGRDPGVVGADPGSYATAALAEIELAQRVLGEHGGPGAVTTIFIGGGTPTLLAGSELARMVGGIAEVWTMAADAEITVEANPDTVTPQLAQTLAAAGVTRVSIGMQSAVPEVLAVLDRTHDPANVATAVEAARTAGLQVSLDLIYGTPGESIQQWRRSVTTALELGPDHVSAYALIVEDGTKLAAQVRRGQVPAPVDDDQADKYELADDLLSAAGYAWYEVSNWATRPEARCRHNLAYWRSSNWWGIGPGAHSHIGGVRWWNVKHPAAYAARLSEGRSPGHGREILTPAQQRDEAVLLESRISDGVAVAGIADPARAGDADRVRRVVARLIAEELIEPVAAIRGRVVLTRRGRLLADTVVHRLLG